MKQTYDTTFKEKLKKRDEKAYVVLFDQLFVSLHQLACSYVLDSDIANDVVQDAFISIYENTQKIDAISNIESYMHTIVRNRCYNYLRDLALEDRNKELYVREMIETNNWNDSEKAKLSEEVHQIIDSLPTSCREICYLRFYKGEKIKDIANQLSLSENTVKVQLHRAMNKIKESFLEENSINFPLKKLSIVVFFSLFM